ncbi:MAG: class I SAM-dependent methyltransferase [bacterium]
MKIENTALHKIRKRFTQGDLLDTQGRVIARSMPLIDQRGQALVQEEWLYSHMTDLELTELTDYFDNCGQDQRVRLTSKCELQHKELQQFLKLSQLQRISIRRLVREILLGVPREISNYFYLYEAPKYCEQGKWIISLVSESTEYRKHLLAAIRNLLPVQLPEITHILSVGCGDGRFEAGLKELGFYVVGLELDADNIQKSSQRGIQVIKGDAHEMSRLVKHASIDLILYSEVIGNLGIKKTMVEALQLLKSGGKILITTYEMPAYQSLQSAADPVYRDTYKYNKVARNVIRRNVESAGLQGFQVQALPPYSTDDGKFKHIVMDLFLASKPLQGNSESNPNK